VSDVLSVTPSLDSIEVNSQRRAKASVFTVSNPFLWVPLIQQVAQGKITGELIAHAQHLYLKSHAPASPESPKARPDAMTARVEQRMIPSEDARRLFSKPPANKPQANN